MNTSLHYLLACIALVMGGALVAVAMLEEAALCALFSLACLHQAHVFAAERDLRRLDDLLFVILRQLDEVRRKAF